MVEYSKVNVKLTDTKLKKIKTAAKKNRNNCKNQFENVQWRLSTSWIIIDNKRKDKANAINNNMSNDIKLSKAQNF